MYYDKNGKLIKNGDTLCFENIGYFEVVIKEKITLKKLGDDEFPQLLLKNMVLNHYIDSAYVVKNK